MCRPYVLPDHYTIPLVPGDFNQVDRPCGMLFVTVVSAINVPKMDWFNGSDPYVRYVYMTCSTPVLFCLAVLRENCIVLPYKYEITVTLSRTNGHNQRRPMTALAMHNSPDPLSSSCWWQLHACPRLHATASMATACTWCCKHGSSFMMYACAPPPPSCRPSTPRSPTEGHP